MQSHNKQKYTGETLQQDQYHSRRCNFHINSNPMVILCADSLRSFGIGLPPPSMRKFILESWREGSFWLFRILYTLLIDPGSKGVNQAFVKTLAMYIYLNSRLKCATYIQVQLGRDKTTLSSPIRYRNMRFFFPKSTGHPQTARRECIGT